MAKVAIQVIGVSALSSMVDGLSLEGNTPAEVIDQLVEKLGPEFKNALYNEQGRIDYSVQSLLNGEIWIERDKPAAYQLRDGDKIMILGVMSGG